MITLGSGDFEKILSDIGSWYPMKIGSVSLNTYGEGSVTWTTGVSGYGLIRPVNENMNLVREGVLKVGDARVFVLPNALRCVEVGSQTQMQFEGIWYEAMQPEKHKVGAEPIYDVSNLKRVI